MNRTEKRRKILKEFRYKIGHAHVLVCHGSQN